MKAITVTSAAMLSLLLAIAAPAAPRQEQHGDRQDHAKQEQGTRAHGKSEPQHAQRAPQPERARQQAQHAQPQQEQHRSPQRSQPQQREQNRQPHNAQQQQRRGQSHQPQYAQQLRNHERPQRNQERQGVRQSAWQQHRAQSWQSDHRTWQQRGGYRGYRIPDARFRGYFGPEHGFRIYGLPFLVVGGYPRFRYSGYWFSLVDPWPEYWANNWYDTDDVYVTYADSGYYLFNRRYPNAAIAIRISL